MCTHKSLIFKIQKIDPTQAHSQTIKKRSLWTNKEDNLLIELIHHYGSSDWNIIETEMSKFPIGISRTARQIKERYMNHFHPTIKKKSLSREEKKILIEKYVEHGNKWSKIAESLPGRTESIIKNYFYSNFRKFLRHVVKSISWELKLTGTKINSNDVYKLIRKEKVSLNEVNRDFVLKIIQKHSDELNRINHNKHNNKNLDNQIANSNVSDTGTDQAIAQNRLHVLKIVNESSLEL